MLHPSPRRLILGALLLTACASAGPPPPPPPPPPPVLFVEDPIDLLPELQGALHVNMRRLRADEEIFARLLERAIASADDETEAEHMRFLAEHTDTVLLGVGRRVGDDPDLVLVLRTKGAKLLAEDGTTLGTATEIGALGFPQAKLGGDDLVLVDDYTAILYEPGLRTGVEALLAKRPGKRFRDEPAFTGLAKEVAFGSAPVSLLGTLPPQFITKMSSRAPPALAPLVSALTTVHSYGGQLDLAETLDLRVFAQGRGSSAVGVLAGAILMMKNALVQGGDDPKIASMAKRVRVEARGDVLELSYALSRSELLELLDGWLQNEAGKGDGKTPPPDASEI